MQQFFVGLYTEGTTDVRFLEAIVRKTLEEVAFKCRKPIEIEVIPLQKRLDERDFISSIEVIARLAYASGANFLCLHLDADASDHEVVFNRKINPLINHMKTISGADICNNILPLVLVQMTEAWMLADLSLLKEEIGTQLSDKQLGLLRAAESIADPKQTIQEAIRTARANLSKRRRRSLSIGDLYEPIGNRISIDKLEQLASYRKFKGFVEDGFREMGLLP